MLNSLWMLFAKPFGHGAIIILVKVKVAGGEHLVLLYDLVKDVDIQWKSLGTVKLLDQLSANWASYTILVMKLRDAVCAQSVTAMNQNSWNSFSNVIFETTELTNIETS